MKELICTVIGAVGSAIAGAFGGWTAGLTTLAIFMAIDYVTGLLVAGVFHTSEKTETGGLESRAGWKGLIRKGVTLLMVLIACRVDVLLGVNYIRDGVVIAFCVNEAISIVENAGLMGVPVPKILSGAIELLRKKGDAEGTAQKDSEQISETGKEKSK
ncbi:MAG: phage holin family protein [Oscillospiraceae bacterium]|nr:phage holin family protein [Oscillospiraceae bacterium]